uniref:Uncharacterized protein n=1 Tax=Clastoptera arizonana TaxID=38151 RepID=A0A1B6C384_9HEMI
MNGATTNNIFGILATGRLVQTDFSQVGSKQFLINIPDADDINYISVFMTGVEPFPEGLAGLIYFSWPDPDAPPNWQLLGYIANDKPSSVFKISTLKKNHELLAPKTGMLSFDQRKISHVAQIGISVETIDVVQQQIALIDKTAKNQTLFVEFSQKMIQNLFNFASSFAVTQAQMTPNPNETFIPLSVVQNWYQNFERRLAINPYFWQS